MCPTMNITGIVTVSESEALIHSTLVPISPGAQADEITKN